MFAEWIRKYFGGIRFFLTLFALSIETVTVAFVFVFTFMGKEIPIAAYGFVAGIFAQVIATQWFETKRKTGEGDGKN